MSKSLNVIALISGGKDSFFSLLHCIDNGHRIVALANLFPPSSPTIEVSASNANGILSGENAKVDIPLDETDSYMYQTAGHNLIPLYAEALELPLYRHAIIGTAVDYSRYYADRPGDAQSDSGHPRDPDETESLIPLLRSVMAAHPEASAVCSGAILSTYQRTRIESVALRLGLVPLSYLWQYPVLPPPSPGGLLNDMAVLEFDVRIVKVASGGLNDDLLWHNLMDLAVRRKVEKAMVRFGGSVLGEGGEYETLVIDGPWPMWKRRVDIDRTRMQRHTESGSGGTASLAFYAGAGHSVPKEWKSSQDRSIGLRKISLWDKEFDELKRSLGMVIDHPTAGIQEGTSHRSDQELCESWTAVCYRKSLGPWCFISNLTCESAGASATEQMVGICDMILKNMAMIDCFSKDIVFTTIILQSIAEDYAAVNDVYGQLFTKPNPPARVTISTNLPWKVRVMVSLVVDRGESDLRDGLHVQSRSYWAPANIGPYSQAISVPIETLASLIYVAGQIPLVPANMEISMPEDNGETDKSHIHDLSLFQHHACLSLQHLWRIGTQMRVGWWSGAIAFVTSTSDMMLKARVAHQTWRSIHDPHLWANKDEEEGVLDAWDRTYGGLGSLVKESQAPNLLPDYTLLISAGTSSPVPGFLAVEVNQLPRDSDIEWQSLGVAKGKVQFLNLDLVGAAATVCSIPSAEISIVYTYVRKMNDAKSVDHLMDTITNVWDEILAHSRSGHQESSYTMTVYTPWVHAMANLKAQIIPCKAVWGPIGDAFEELSAGIVLHSRAHKARSDLGNV